MQMYGRADGKEKAFKTSNNKCSSRQQSNQPSSSSSPIPITKKRRLLLHATDTVNGHLLASPNQPVDITIDTRCPSPLTTSTSTIERDARHDILMTAPSLHALHFHLPHRVYYLDNTIAHEYHHR